VDCTLRDGKVEVEAFYDDDSPAAKAKVQVVDLNEKVVASGATDASGKWTFAAPPPGRYEVRVDAGAGHRARKKIEVPARAAPPESQTTPAPAENITDGQTRADFTRVPWVNVLLGLAILATVGAACALVALWRKNAHKEAGTCDQSQR
jgi:hypothetical protein